MADLYKETTIQKSLKNKNIVEVYKAFEADGQLIIVMEYCSGGELKDHVVKNNGLDELECRDLIG